MALTTTIGSPSANSMVTLAEADSYLATRANVITTWGALTTTDKDLRLRLGAKMIGMLPLGGRKACLTQAMPFPRLKTTDALYGLGTFQLSSTTGELTYIQAAYGIGCDNLSFDNRGLYELWEDVTDAATSAGVTAPTVPQDVKDAQCELAARVAHEILTVTTMTASDGGIQSVDLMGDVSVTFNSQSIEQATKKYLGGGKLSSLSIIQVLLGTWLRPIRMRLI